MPNRRLRCRTLIAGVLAAALGGCAGVSRGPGATPPVPASAASPRVSLESEQRRFADLFRGTPVVFMMQADGSLKTTVPLTFAFDRGRFAVKPPLAAVLDRLAVSQRAERTRFLVAAPADPQSKGLLLATERATSARDYLVGRGIDPSRFAISALGTGDSVVIVVADGAPH